MTLERRTALGVLCIALSSSLSRHPLHQQHHGVGVVEGFTTHHMPMSRGIFTTNHGTTTATRPDTETRLWISPNNGQPPPTSSSSSAQQPTNPTTTSQRRRPRSSSRTSGKLQAMATGTTLEKPQSSFRPQQQQQQAQQRLNVDGTPSHRQQPTLPQQQQQQNRPGRRRRQQHSSVYRAMYTQHELLSKEREQAYAKALKRAQTIQQQLSQLRIVWEQQEEKNNNNNIHNNNNHDKPKRKQGRPRGINDQPLVPTYNPFERRIDRQDNMDASYDLEEEDELQHLSIYGVEQLEAQPIANWDPELRPEYSDGDDYLEYSRNVNWQEDNTAATAFIPTIPDTRGRTKQTKRGQKESEWELSKQERRSVADLVQTMTDAQIQKFLHLPGGRLELRAILLEGALARDALIRNNIRLVVSIAKKWCKQNARRGGGDYVSNVDQYRGGWGRPSLDEVIQEGIIGLSKAADRFESKRNLRFSTYATFWITSYIRRCFHKAATSGIRLPQGFHETRSRFKALVKSYHEQGKEVPPLTELASEMGLKTERLEWILHSTKPTVSVDAPLFAGGVTMAGKSGNEDAGQQLLGDSLVDDQPSPAEQVELSLLRQSLENAMASELVPYERDILRLRLGLDDGVSRTVPQIVKEYGGALSSSEIRTAELRAYKKLRSPSTLSTYKLMSWLDFDIDEEESLLVRSRR
eukprot:CAMPEP_0168770262 /NCGR_PEP_ID=MMETSP0725-20121227/2824_1 /TAXON_ID=265536 /ORGANISM="Amphiprora sp., Strain CCMP467" /LENGTH=691 /DNA_ID=CAMNT_0008819691 /DNA_START=48 /DNA_END=2126 /DNA_ORIENTATION=+